jgi:hypothetical protein
VVLTESAYSGSDASLGERRLPVSSGGGVDPHWRKDGKEMNYCAPDGTLMAVSVYSSGTVVKLGKPSPLPIRIVDSAGASNSNWTADSTHTTFVIFEAPMAQRQTFEVLLGSTP